MVVIFCFLRLLPPPVVVHVAGNLLLTPRLCILHTSKEAGTSSMGSKVSEAGNRCTRCVGRVSLSDQTRTPPILQQPISFLKPHKNSNTSCMSLSPVLFKRRCAIPCLPIGAMAKERWGGGVLNSLKSCVYGSFETDSQATRALASLDAFRPKQSNCNSLAIGSPIKQVESPSPTCQAAFACYVP